MKLLLIEDDNLLRKHLIKGLTEEGYAVDASGDGLEGSWYARTGEYDAVILDIMLPGKNGLEILRQLRGTGRDLRVLLLTARDAVADRVEGLDAGADDYLVKPFAFEELLARIRAMVRHAYGDNDPVIRIADLVIDTNSKKAKRHGKTIELTAREYSLLEYLARRRGQVVSRSDIWEHLYEFHDATESNVVDVYIHYLRRKIDRDDAPRLIHTRRGLGYVLGEPS